MEKYCRRGCGQAGDGYGALLDCLASVTGERYFPGHTGNEVKLGSSPFHVMGSVRGGPKFMLSAQDQTFRNLCRHTFINIQMSAFY